VVYAAPDFTRRQEFLPTKTNRKIAEFSIKAALSSDITVDDCVLMTAVIGLSRCHLGLDQYWLCKVWSHSLPSSFFLLLRNINFLVLLLKQIFDRNITPSSDSNDLDS